ncbi:DUF6518 family protein [Metabacillus iocasae]|uniref:Uncharacterized protein n=1 Tax=Priestia iocasae TaxID=2291674 RepID=A0ABS2QTV7_9BACI|nr:hypothetical protein [Metabacillus iocasae]
MRARLDAIRKKSQDERTVQRKLTYLVLLVLVGATFGFVSKYVDGSSLGLIGSDISFWVVVTTIIAAWSRSPRAAALHACLFLSAMLIVYYLYSMILFGFFPTSYFIGWGSIALLSPIAGYIIWFSRGEGWLAACIAAAPISVLIVNGSSFFYVLSLEVSSLWTTQGFSLLSAVILFLFLPNHSKQRLRIIPPLILFYFVIEYSDLMYYFPS